jgi:hypothetical protein
MTVVITIHLHYWPLWQDHSLYFKGEWTSPVAERALLVIAAHGKWIVTLDADG